MTPSRATAASIRSPVSLLIVIVTSTHRSRSVTGDGNSYTSVTISSQTWLGENLKTTKFNDGTPIPNVKDDVAWASLSTPGYCWYDNDSTHKTPYGAMYNWYTVGKNNNGNKNVCPIGWHVPTDAEFMTLANNLGGIGVAGSKMQETGTTHWYSANAAYANNSSGFSAVGAGYRSTMPGMQWFMAIWGYTAYWNTDQKNVYIQADAGLHFDSHLLTYGFSVRCIKDIANEITESKTSNSCYLYPNPNNGEFTLIFNNPNNLSIQISIVTITGETVFETKSNKETFNYNSEKLQSGIYIVTVKGENVTHISKMIVK